MTEKNQNSEVPTILQRESTRPDGSIDSDVLDLLLKREMLVDRLGDRSLIDREPLQNKLQEHYKEITQAKQEAGIIEPQHQIPPLDNN